MNWQLFDALGIFLGFSANLMVAPLGWSANSQMRYPVTDISQVAARGDG